MMQLGFFDWQKRIEKLQKNGDPLVRINKVIDWAIFRPELEKLREKDRKSNAGAPGYDLVLMFKILVLQSLYNLSDESAENQVLDRLSFMKFLGMKPGDKTPDAKTIWLFRETAQKAGILEGLFHRFDEILNQNGFTAKKGQIIDASIVEAPKQRNSREENELIKKGQQPQGWDEAKQRQKDVDARWTKKNGKNYYGYKNHICIDVKHKLIRSYDVTNASAHDSAVFEQLLDKRNSSRDVYADSAYRSEEAIKKLQKEQFREHLQRKGCKNRQLTSWELQGNRSRAKIRSRVEHVFGAQAITAVTLIIRTIGIARARVKIGLRNLAYNINRFSILMTAG
jgi:IS5 family transposase